MASLLKVVLIAVTTLTLISVSDCLKTRGQSFALSFLDNEVEYWQDLPLEVWVINDGLNPAQVTISAPRDNNLLRPECTGDKVVTVQPGAQHKFGVCWWAKIFTSDNTVNDKVIRIDSDNDISVIAVNKEAFSADSFQVLPISSLGTSYYTVVGGSGGKQPNSFAVIATEDDTSITISLPENAEGPPVSLNHRCLVHESGSTFTIRLFAHQVFYMMTLADVTGTKILSSQPIAVFNGNTRASLPATSGTRDHLCEQLISVGNWDMEYVYIPISSDSDSDIVRVVSDLPNTVINYVDSAGSSRSFTLNIGEWEELLLSDYTYLSSTKKFSAVLITQTYMSSADGMYRDPTLMNLQGLAQWMNSYTLPAFTSAHSTLNNGSPAPYPNNSLAITMRDGDTSGLRLDGAAVPSIQWFSLPGNIGMQAGILDVDGSDSHVLTHANGEDFGVFMFSSSDKETMGTTLGLNAPPQCEQMVMRRGDEADNDCDGDVDEETCDGIDNDSDGLVDEDCASSTGKARGRTYLLAFPDNSKSDGSQSDLNKLELYISPQTTGEGAADTQVTVSNPRGTYSTTISAPAFNTTRIDIPVDLRMPQGSDKYDRGLLIEASEDIVVYAINKIKFSSESYLGIPLDATGYDYYVATITVIDSNDVAEFVVCASEVGTTELRITLADISGGGVSFENHFYAPGTTLDTSLVQYQCLQLQSAKDLTGTRVMSTNRKRISVFSGNRRPRIGSQGAARDHIVEQMNPVPTWGREFFTNPIKRDGTQGATRGDIFRVIASEDSTVVTISSTGPAAAVETIPNKGGFIEIDIESTEFAMISATHPVLVVQYTKTQFDNNENVDKGDPSMTIVVPKESWTNDYRFVTPRSGQLSPGTTDVYLPYTSRMSIVIEKQFISKLRYSTVDELFSTHFPNAIWTDIPGTNPIVSATTVDVEFGQNYVTAVDDNVFSAMIYGAADREFYANPISLKLLPGLCTESTQVMGDGVDNDCDDSIDEELCNGFDDDNDGLIDEDCSMPPDGSQGRYIFSFMENIVEYPLINPLTIMATSTCPGVTNVRLQTPGAPSHLSCDINVMISEGGLQRFALPDFFRQPGTGIFDKSILMETSCAIDIAAYNMDKFSNDAFMVLPAHQLGREYRTISYYPTTLGSVVSAIASNATTITVSLPAHSDSTPSVRHPITNESFTGGQSFQLDLAQYQSMQLISSGDLSGTIITSASNDISVFSGNIRVGIGSKSRDHLVEQLTPWSVASNEWIVAANGMTSEEIIKFTCDVGASITFQQINGVPERTFTFTNPGQVEQYEVPQYYSARVTSTAGNCQLMVITKSQATKQDPLLGDPTMSIIVPVTQYITRATFAIPSKAWRKLHNGDVDDYIANLVVVTRTDQTGAIKLDGFGISGWNSVDNTIYSVVRVQVQRKANGESSVIESDNGERFEARLWGVADRESFAYPLGVNY